MEESLSQFCIITCADPEKARRFLDGRTLDEAVELYFAVPDAFDEMDEDHAAAAFAGFDWADFGGDAVEQDVCVNGCGRAAAEGFPTCCRTCTAHCGSRHGPACEEAQAGSRPSGSGAASSLARGPWASDRLELLLDVLLTPAVQVPLPVDAREEAACLSDREVERRFTDHVPGVRGFAYRETGDKALDFMVEAYNAGLKAFRTTPVHNHILWLMRVVVHRGSPAALREVAEAFMDCQAVQARVIERVGLEILGVSADFRGLVVSLVSEYKSMALRMLAREHVDSGLVTEDKTATHYENRLTADLGPELGLNAADVRRAALDGHAASRFPTLSGAARQTALGRFHHHFDVEALLRAFAAEASSFSEQSPPGSLPRLFLAWADTHLVHKYVVLDEATCVNVQVGDELALAVLEAVFLGGPQAKPDELYRGVPINSLFRVGTDDTS